MVSAEVEGSDRETGARKGSKLARFDLIPPRVLWMLSEHYGRGAQKYDDHNWRKGMPWSWHYAAVQRHLNLFWAGHDYDVDTKLAEGDEEVLHLVSAFWHIAALLEGQEAHPDKDDRYIVTAPVADQDGEINAEEDHHFRGSQR